MNIGRDRVRALVRDELVRRLGRSAAPSPGSPAVASHPALIEIRIESDCSAPADFSKSRPCVIEPDRPCYNSGYCRRLGY